jgi:multiple sugar transport system permease protein
MTLRKRLSTLRKTKQWQRFLRHVGSYLILGAAAAFMLFPMLWMLSASFKPPWQIFTNPPIWIPQAWETTTAGDTNREINLWRVEHDGQTRTVARIGTRKYTTVINVARMPELQFAPSDDLSDATTQAIDGVLFNVRDWDGQQVVALARGDGDTLAVVPVAALSSAAARLPLDQVNAGDRLRTEIAGITFRGRTIEMDGISMDLIALGPESELSIVAPVDSVSSARLADVDAIAEGGFADVGETELRLYDIEGDSSEQQYVLISQESWQPILDKSELDEQAFIVANAAVDAWRADRVNGLLVEVGDYEGRQVVLLARGTQESLVIFADDAATLQLAQLGGLTRTRGDVFGRIPYRVQDNFGEGVGAIEMRNVALVGESREMALLVPQDGISGAFDIDPALLERALYPQLRIQGYVDALTTQVAEVRFPRFFFNSGVLVTLNIIGHLLSCVVVAYAFARLRAPGKNVLFVVLLSTMMLPFPVTIVPVYELFRDLGMVNTWWPLFVRSFFGNPFLIFMLRQFFTTIPRELEEAARIDGASTLQIIWNVIVPLSKPAIATVVIFTFWWNWNSFFEPFIFLSSPELFPVSVGLNFFKDQFGTIYYDRLIAASVLVMLPMVLLFFFAQRYFIEGIQLSGLKG